MGGSIYASDMDAWTDRLDDNTKAYLKSEFRKYYFEQASSIAIPADIPRREFGFLNFDDSMVRHLSCKDEGELRALLVRESPRGVFVSTARYENPSLPMEEKGLLSADLVFDIDAGDLNLPCSKEHDFYLCGACGTPSWSGTSPCGSCGSNNVRAVKWTCPECISGSLKEANKLVDILESDFGISRSSIELYFSGNRGHHIHVSDSEYDQLDQPARAEMVEYLEGKGLTPRLFGFSSRWSDFDVSKLPAEGEPGWRGRLATLVAGKQRQNAREAFVSLFNQHKERFPDLMSQMLRELSVAVDAAVTTDTHRIFRMGGTLHDKSGLAKKLLKNTDEDPLVSAVVIGSSPVNVHVIFAPSFELRGEKFGPFRSSDVRLPSYAAVYLAAKGLARVKP